MQECVNKGNLVKVLKGKVAKDIGNIGVDGNRALDYTEWCP